MTLYASLILISVSGFVFSACTNPAVSAEKQATDFEAQFPDHIHSISVDGKTLRYASSGDPQKRPLLFVHGSPGSWQGWGNFVANPELQKRFQILAVDRPGYGGTDAGISEASLRAQADLIMKALDSNLSQKPAILVGHSYGGPVIAKTAAVYPEKIAGLVFVAASVSPDLEKIKWFQYPATWWPIRVLIPSSLRVCNEEIFSLKDELSKMLPEWKNISARSVIIHGEDDPLVPIENVEFLKAHLRSESIVQIVRVPGLNHFIPWKRPDLILNGIATLEKDIQ